MRPGGADRGQLGKVDSGRAAQDAAAEEAAYRGVLRCARLCADRTPGGARVLQR
jgi:hypothetical protein